MTNKHILVKLWAKLWLLLFDAIVTLTSRATFFGLVTKPGDHSWLEPTVTWPTWFSAKSRASVCSWLGTRVAPNPGETQSFVWMDWRSSFTIPVCTGGNENKTYLLQSFQAIGLMSIWHSRSMKVLVKNLHQHGHVALHTLFSMQIYFSACSRSLRPNLARESRGARVTWRGWRTSLTMLWLADCFTLIRPNDNLSACLDEAGWKSCDFDHWDWNQRQTIVCSPPQCRTAFFPTEIWHFTIWWVWEGQLTVCCPSPVQPLTLSNVCGTNSVKVHPNRLYGKQTVPCCVCVCVCRAPFTQFGPKRWVLVKTYSHSCRTFGLLMTLYWVHGRWLLVFWRFGHSTS